MEVKGEYGMASSTVGGGRYASPSPLAVCHPPLLYADMATCRVEQQRRGGRRGAAFGRAVRFDRQGALRVCYGGSRRRMVTTECPLTRQ